MWTGTAPIDYDTHQRNVDRIFKQQYEFDGYVDTTALGSATDAVSSKNVNNLRNKGIQVVYCTELAGANANFMLGRKARRNFKFRIRKNLTAKWEFGRRNRTRSVFNHMRLMVGVTDYTDVVGRPHS